MQKLILIISTILFTTGIQAQETKHIYGYVTDPFGNPLEQVQVISQEKFSSTSTNASGWYSLEIMAADTIIRFHKAGYQKYIAPVDQNFRFDVQLKAIANEEIYIMEDEVEMDFEAMPTTRMAKTNAVMPHVIGGAYPLENRNTENYAAIRENGFKNAWANPLSTFSVDVDNASYSNVRRFITQGLLPPVDAVRVEEMINYFSYKYPEPTGEHPFSVYTELGACPWNPDHYLLHVGLKGQRIEKEDLPNSNLVFLIDVSGSMYASNKLPLLKRAFKMLVNELRPNDRVAIVVYAGSAGQVLESTAGNQKQKIIAALDRLQAGGSTAGGQGLKLAYQIANENFIDGGNNRIVLATDGDFNVGVSSTSEMERLVEKERESGVFVSVLGFGMGNIKDDRMEVIADRGNGNYAYIDNIREARKVFITEFGGTLFTIAKDVKFQLEFNPQQVKSYRLVGYENRLLNAEDFNDDTKDAGEMGAGHTVTALYEIITADADEEIPSVDELKYQEQNISAGKKSGDLLTIKLRYKAPDGNKSILMEQAVDSKPQQKTSDSFRFSAAVAGFGMLLRGSAFKGETSVEQILALARNAKGTDEEGYRAEFIQLVKTVGDLDVFAEERD